MEITFMKQFCQAGNLRNLLRQPGLPTSIAPYLQQLQSFYDPAPFLPKFNQQQNEEVLNEHLFHLLIQKINKNFPIEGKSWVSSSDFSMEKASCQSKFLPLKSCLVLEITKQNKNLPPPPSSLQNERLLIININDIRINSLNVENTQALVEDSSIGKCIPVMFKNLCQAELIKYNIENPNFQWDNKGQSKWDEH
ncbi:hypothetical protein BY996DRAFT_8447962 [Phakopsora pachyrhizi]|nr:hypothetical protein BY996DRAFT_8447962 [Phakopsora pachyrhizi]